MLAPVAQLTPETLAVELDVVRNELRQRNETGFVGEMFGAMQAAVFPADHPYARPIIGTHQSLSAIKPEDIEAFLRTHYRPDNMTLVIVGDLDPRAVDPIIEGSLPPQLLAAPTPIKPGPRMAPRAPEPPAPPAAKFRRQEGAVATPELWIGWSLPRSFDTEAYLAQFLARRANEQLRQASRVDEDIAFVSTALAAGTQASMLLCRVVLNRGEHPERSMEHVLNQLYTLWGRPGNAGRTQMDERNFAFQKRAAVVDMLLEAEDIRARGVARATITHFSQDPALYARAVRDVVALERPRLVDLASRYVTRDRARAVLFTPPVGGGAQPPALPMSAPALDEEDPVPMRVDEDRLKRMVPAPGVSSYRQLDLPNGLEVIIGRRPGLPVVNVSLMLRAGMASVDPAAARVASMLAKPKETWHGEPQEFGSQLQQRYGKDRSVYSLDGAAGNVGIMLAVLAERVRSMDVDTGRWSPFLTHAVPFLRLAEQKPEIIADRAFRAALYGDHPFARLATGMDLEGSSTGAAQAWIDATHTPRNAVLVVVGEVDPIEVEKIVHEQFEEWKDRGPALDAPPAALGEAKPTAPRFLVTPRPGATQAEIQFGCVLPPAREPAVNMQHAVGAAIVEDRLGRVLRQQLGATYGINATARVFVGGTSAHEIRGTVENAKLAKALATLTATLTDLAAAPVSPRGLADAKLALARGEGTSRVTNRDVAEGVLGARGVGYLLEDIDAYPKLLAQVSAEAVQGDFQRCLRGRPTVMIVGDEPVVRAAIKEASSPPPPSAPTPAPPQ